MQSLKSKLSAKTFHNHFPEGHFKERQSLAKNLPSECNRCCTHVMLQELTRGPTFGSAKYPRKRFRQSRARAVLCFAFFFLNMLWSRHVKPSPAKKVRKAKEAGLRMSKYVQTEPFRNQHDVQSMIRCTIENELERIT